MKTKDQQNFDTNRQSLIHGVIKAEQPVNTSRRNFGKTSLAASGVLLTLSSRSALAALPCQSPSGNISGNASAAHTQYTCSGFTHLQWSAIPPPVWPAGLLPGTALNNWTTGTAFNAIPGINPASIYATYSMMNVMLQNPPQTLADPSQVGRNIVAAYLNALDGRTNGALSTTQVVTIFNEWHLNGVYHPTAGVTWTPAQIVSYLQSTMG